MREGHASRTAEHNAFFRALESALPERRRLFEDRLARAFLTWPFAIGTWLAVVPGFRELVPRFIDHRWPGVRSSVVALGIAATGLAALIDYVASRTADAGSILHAWSALAALRILSAPLFALAFLLSGLFVPNRSSRIALLVATAIEAATSRSSGFIHFALRDIHRLASVATA